MTLIKITLKIMSNLSSPTPRSLSDESSIIGTQLSSLAVTSGIEITHQYGNDYHLLTMSFDTVDQTAIMGYITGNFSHTVMPTITTIKQRVSNGIEPAYGSAVIS